MLLGSLHFHNFAGFSDLAAKSVRKKIDAVQVDIETRIVVVSWLCEMTLSVCEKIVALGRQLTVNHINVGPN